eukprot:jgi/Hompol1/658/HPOL_001270-RA
MLARIHNIQKDGGKADFAYDHEGRIMLVNRVTPGKLMTHGVKSRIVTDELLVPSGTQGSKATTAVSLAGGSSRFGKEDPRNNTAGNAKDTATSIGQESSNIEGHVSFKVGGGNVATMTGPQPPSDGKPKLSNRGIGGGAGAGGGGGRKILNRAQENTTGYSVTERETDPSHITPGVAMAGKSALVANSIDAMKLSPGVTLKEGDAVRKGPAIVAKKPKEPTRPTVPPMLSSRAPSYNVARQPLPLVTQPSPVDTTQEQLLQPQATTQKMDPLLERVIAKSRPVLKPIAFPMFKPTKQPN